MNYQVTDEIKDVVGELYMLRDIVESMLGVASAAARDEWVNLRWQIPSLEEIASGFVLLPYEELEQMRAKISRFGRILATPTRAPARAARRRSRTATAKVNES
jgi:hypothetical protein